MMSSQTRVLIAGAGPTGLGAAWRLEEIARLDGPSAEWTLVEQLPECGGMARSESIDGYVWDVGGHVLFPHYRYFDDLLDELIDDWEYVTPVRGAWMWGRFVPYPVQGNLSRFPVESRELVLSELSQPREGDPATFEDFLRLQFGDTLYREFFLPLNLKMWATHPSKMAWHWANHRSGSQVANVPRVDVDTLRADIASGRDAPAWDADTKIRYPATGGTGRIWRELADRLPSERLHFGTAVTRILAHERRVELSSGAMVPYDHLITSIPLDRLLRSIADRPDLAEFAERIRPAAVDVVGVGLAGVPPECLADVCSLYVPDPEIAFWRITLLSNYSAGCVPASGAHWSVLCEVNRGDDRPRPDGPVLDAVVAGLERLGFIDRRNIDSTWHRSISHGYPVPRLDTCDVLAEVEPELARLGIVSRGRFGGWRYHVSNQDHAFMQGLEAVDRLLLAVPEATYPDDVAITYEDGRRWS
jgi:protoporphyrinogen oxidase